MVRSLRRLSAASIALVFAFPHAAQGFTDCNTNGIDDSTDISAGTSLDCDNNTVPDECDDPAHPGRVHNITLDAWYCGIQEAIDAATNGHEIVVSPGTYYERITFGGKAITLRSEDPADWSVVQATVIDGDGLGPVVRFDTGEGQDSIIEGFSITGGNWSEGGGPRGGGIYCSDSSPVIRYNDIHGNGALGGGGIWVGDTPELPVVIENNVIRDNWARQCDAFVSQCKGGGIACGNRAAIRNNLILRNTALDESGDLSIGGGISCGGGPNVLIAGNTIVANKAVLYPAIVGPPGASSPRANVSNCVIWGNHNPFARGWRTLPCRQGGDLIQHHNPFARGWRTSVSIAGCSLVYSSVDDFVLNGPGVIHELPRFVDAENGDYRLLPWSPCVNAGTSGVVEPGETDADFNDRIMGGTVDIGAYELPFSSTYQTLWVVSTPRHGVTVEVTPPDVNADSNGATNFSRDYNPDTQVTLTAPSSDGYADFRHWIVDHGDANTNATITVTMGRAHVARAVYVNTRHVCATGGDFTTIQAAIDASSNGDEVVVCPGTYNKSINLNGKAITLRNEDPADPGLVQSTIIKAVADSSAVTCASGETFDTIIEGFTISGGGGTWVAGLGAWCGGGLYCSGSDPTLRNNLLVGNGEGSLFAYGGATFCHVDARPKIVGNTVADNSVGGFGGGLLCYEASPLVEGNIFAGNRTAEGYVGGGGIMVWRSFPSIVNDLIAGNVSVPDPPDADIGGGGIYYDTHPGSLLVNNTVAFNGSGQPSAGGIHSYGGAPTVTNCIVWGNAGDELGQDVNHEYSCVEGFSPLPGDTSIGDAPEFVGGPSGTWSANGVYDSATLKTLLTDSSASWTADALVGKLVNPDTTQWLQFVIVDNDATTVTVLGDASGIAGADDSYQVYDYHLQADGTGVTSPCIDTGTNGAFPWDITTDLDGLRRFVDVPWANTSGTETIDMGAYERDPVPPEIVGSWYSWKYHGATLGDLAKEFDPSFTGIPDKSNTPEVDGVGVETRRQSVTELTLTFSEPINTETLTVAGQEVTVCGNVNGPYHPTGIAWAPGPNGPNTELTLSFDANQIPNGFNQASQADRYVAVVSTNVKDLAGNVLGGDRDVEFIAQFGNVWTKRVGKYVVDGTDQAKLQLQYSQSPTAAVAVWYDVWNKGVGAGVIDGTDEAKLQQSFTLPGQEVSATVPSCP